MNFRYFPQIFTQFLALGILASNCLAEVRHITPPKLDEEHLGKRILCHRPMRRGSPMIEIEQKGSQIIAHNYGHGGSGWTLAPGSAKHVINELRSQLGGKALSQPVAIVGGGALGLFSAIELLNQGFTNISIIAEKFENLTSHNAGGLLAPVSMDNSPEMQKLIDQIGIEAYKFYRNIAENRHPFIKRGVRIVPTYFFTREDSGLEPFVGKVMEPAKDVTLDFGNGTQKDMVAYDDGIFIDTGSLMNQMRSYLETISLHDPSKKVVFIERKVRNFSELNEEIIINCSGLGSEELNQDKALVSVQGHLIMLKDQKPENLEHMILVYFGKGKTKSGFDVKRSFYMFPKKLDGASNDAVGVIGGTFIEGADENTPNDDEFDILLQGAKDFYGIK